MAADTPVIAAEIEVLRRLTQLSLEVVRVNVAGITHDESLIQPQPAGNCLNWVVGHLACINEKLLGLLGGKTVFPAEALKRYDRGSPPIRDDSDAVALPELHRIWEESSGRIDVALAGLAPERLLESAPFSPNDDPNETLGSFITTLAFHQAYHAGQTGVLRRLAGQDGAIP